MKSSYNLQPPSSSQWQTENPKEVSLRDLDTVLQYSLLSKAAGIAVDSTTAFRFKLPASGCLICPYSAWQLVPQSSSRTGTSLQRHHGCTRLRHRRQPRQYAPLSRRSDQPPLHASPAEHLLTKAECCGYIFKSIVKKPFVTV